METTDPNPDGNGNAGLIESFCEITSSSKHEALFFLESHNLDLDAAVSTFFDNNSTILLPQNGAVPASPSPDSDSAENSVQDPGQGHIVDDIFDQAVDTPAPPRNSSRSTSFTGTARLLSGATVPYAPHPIEILTHTITFWRNGFSLDGGPLRTLDDPHNAPFLESIRKSECPKELEPADRKTTVHINLARREEDYPEPVKPHHLPFAGVGRTLGSSSSTSEPIQFQTTAASPTTAPLPAMGLVVDELRPVTSIQLRLADGTRMVSRFNHHHTIRDVRAFIDASRPGGVTSYQLQTMGFPPKQLTDLDHTIEQAGIANSVVIQKL